MRLTAIGFLTALVILAGCAAPQTYRGQSEGGLSPVPNSSPSLGNPEPAPTFQGGGSPSLFKPPARNGGPSLKMPEALKDDSPIRSSRLQAPTPKTQTSRYRPGLPSDPISANSRPAILDEPNWSRFYRSTDRRAIETLMLGNGKRHVAFLGSMHGDEPQSVALVEELARYLKAHPETMRDSTVLLIRSPNPDGLFSRSPYNVHGVDLNRNFPSANWKELKNNRAGNSRGSEAETRQIVRILTDFRPELIVHLKDGRDQGIVNCEGASHEQGQRLADFTSMQVMKDLGQATSGSLESYALNDLKCPSLTLLLPKEPSEQAAWAKNREALLSVLGSATPTRQQTGLLDDEEHDPFAQPRVKKSSTPSSRKTDATPTKSDTKTNARQPKSKLPEFPKGVPDEGYLELPAP